MPTPSARRNSSASTGANRPCRARGPVSEFRGFSAPRQRIELRTSALRCEIWPELGGALAAFESLDEPDGPRALFRPTPVAASYTPLQLSSWPLLPYANRIRDGRFSYAGRAHLLPRN